MLCFPLPNILAIYLCLILLCSKQPEKEEEEEEKEMATQNLFSLTLYFSNVFILFYLFSSSFLILSCGYTCSQAPDLLLHSAAICTIII